MTRDEMMRRMSGRELAAWSALFNVKGEEREHEKHLADSGDGIVIYHGRESDEDRPEDETEGDTAPIEWDDGE